MCNEIRNVPIRPLFGIILWTTLLIPTVQIKGSAAPPDRETVRQTLKQMWDSLATIELREESYPCDEQLQLDLSRGYSQREYAFATEGRRACLTKGIYPETKSEKIVSDVRCDGKKRYLISYFEDGSGTVKSVVISTSDETHENAPTMPVLSMSFVSPFGKPIYRYLDDPATTLENGQAEDGKEIVVLTTQVRGFPVWMELDPAHDWLVLRMKMGDVAEWKVLRFDRDQGRWFPIDGVASNGKGEKRSMSKFVVSNLKINQPIPQSKFIPPSLPKGAFVGDMATGEAQIHGGSREDLNELVREHAPADAQMRRRDQTSGAEKGESPGETITASVEPERHPWGLYMAILSLAMIVLAVGIRYTRRSA